MTEENNNELMNFLRMLQSGAENNTPVEAFQSTPNNPNIELLGLCRRYDFNSSK